MDVEALIAEAKDTMHIKRVFGEPIERDGSLIIPVAVVAGGGGGGSNDGQPEQPAGSGGGFGVWARPIGVYVVRDGQVTFQPAIDTAALAMAAAFLLSRLLRPRRRGRR